MNPTDPDLAGGMRQLSVRITTIAVSLAVGAIIGLFAVGFFKIVVYFNSLWVVPLPRDFSEITWAYSPWVGLALMLSALVAGVILRQLPNGRPHGPADLIDAAQNDKRLDLRSGFLSSFLALCNLSGGASVGLFGPLVHFGGCMSAWIQKSIARLPRDVVLGSGAGAAIAAVFSAPIGGAIFAHEAIIRRFGSFGPGPVIACTFAAYWVSEELIGAHRLFRITAEPILDATNILVALLVGVASSLVAMAYIHAVTEAPRLARASGIALHWRPLLPAVTLFAVSPALPHLLGAGITSIDLAMSGKLAIGFLVILLFTKIAMTAFCLGFGYFGGVFGPALFIGAMLGSMFDLYLAGSGATSSSFVIVAAASCIATVIGAPLAATVMVLELTGSYGWAVLSMISIVVASQIARPFIGRSIFDRQLAARGVVVRDDRPAA